MEKIQNVILGALGRIFSDEILTGVKVQILPVPEGVGADAATNVAMMLAKKVGKAPMEIAEMIVREAEAELVEVGIKCEVVKPGFINFISSDAYLIDKIKDFCVFEPNFEKNISQNAYFGKTVLTEFSDPNPFKVLHVGHLYTSIVGDAMSRMIERAGAKVHRLNFGGDVGMHVAKTMYAILQKRDDFEKMREDGVSAAERAEFMANCYVFGTNCFETDEAKKAEIVALNKRIYEVAARGGDGGGKENNDNLAEIYPEARKWSYAYFEEFYAKIGVKFEKYYPESTVAERGLSEVKKGLEQGVYEESDGAVVFSGEKYGLHTRVFINQAGLPTYEAKDVGLSFTKWDDYKFDESVIITGNDIIEYMKVVLKSISLMKPELAERTVHLTHGNVKLPGNEKMSSRKGNFLRAMDVVNVVKEVMGEKYGKEDEIFVEAGCAEELATELSRQGVILEERGAGIDKVDMKVVLAAIKYAFLKYKMGGDIIFNVRESVSMTGNSGPYLQYSVVRAKKILDKVFGGDVDSEIVAGFGVVADGMFDGYELGEFERKLVKKMGEYTEMMNAAVRERAPYKICAYLYELAQEFSRFYEKTQVVGSEFERERAALVLGYKNVMMDGLSILGIEVPEEM